MKLRVADVAAHPNDHNRTVITLEVDESPVEVRQHLMVPGEEVNASRRGNSLLGEVRVQPRHDDLPPGPKRVVNTARSIAESEKRDDTL